MSVWDAQIFAAAVLNGATFILTEDYQHRRTVEGVTYLNPFTDDFDINEILPP
jgi:predicted nucleic acid-binding protein